MVKLATPLQAASHSLRGCKLRVCPPVLIQPSASLLSYLAIPHSCANFASFAIQQVHAFNRKDRKARKEIGTVQRTTQ